MLWMFEALGAIVYFVNTEQVKEVSGDFITVFKLNSSYTE